MNWKPGTPLSLESENFFLRSMTPTDVTNRYIEWAKDAELMENLNTPPRDISRDQLTRYISRFDNRTRYHLGVFTKESGLHIGFYTIYIDPRTRAAQTNVVIGDRNFWGKSVVLETRAVIIDFLFERLGMQRIWGTPFERNFPSIFNYKAQGFTCEGVMRKHGVRVSGERVDQYIFGLLREEWRARKGSKAAKGSVIEPPPAPDDDAPSENDHRDRL